MFSWKRIDKYIEEPLRFTMEKWLIHIVSAFSNLFTFITSSYKGIQRIFVILFRNVLNSLKKNMKRKYDDMTQLLLDNC